MYTIHWIIITQGGYGYMCYEWTCALPNATAAQKEVCIVSQLVCVQMTSEGIGHGRCQECGST
jgi:hypothetical protein